MTLKQESSLSAKRLREKELAKFRKKYGLRFPTQEELNRREQAALRLRERYIHVPYYAERDRKDGMTFWRMMQSGAVLNN